MRKFKGIELPVNSVIIIALAIFVLLMMAAFFMQGSGSVTQTQLKTAMDQGCSQLSSLHNCNADNVESIKTSALDNGNALTLLKVCQQYYKNPFMTNSQCRDACPMCSNKFINVGDKCPEGVKEGGACGAYGLKCVGGTCQAPTTCEDTDCGTCTEGKSCQLVGGSCQCA